METKKHSTAGRIFAALGISAAFMIAYYLFQLAFSLAGMLALTIFYSVMGTLGGNGGADGVQSALEKAQEAYLTNAAWIFVVCGVTFIAFTWILLRVLYKKGKWNIGRVLEFRKPTGRSSAANICCFFGGMFLSLGCSLLIEKLPVPESWLQANEDSVSALMQGSLLSFVLSASIVAPIVEEIIFRGIFHTSLRDAIPLKRPWPAIIAGVVSSLTFGIYHGNILQGIYTFTFALLLVAVYERTGSMWSSVRMHMGFNSTWLFMILFQGVFKEDSPVNIPLFLGIALVLVVLIFVLAPKREDHAESSDDQHTDNADYNDFSTVS